MLPVFLLSLLLAAAHNSNTLVEVNVLTNQQSSKLQKLPLNGGPRLPEPISETSSDGVAWCVSGGGWRALSASMGFARGLANEKLLQKVRTISAVSGGSWFTLQLAFSKRFYNAVTNSSVTIKKVTHEWFSTYYQEALHAKDVTLIEAAMLNMLDTDDLTDVDKDLRSSSLFVEFKSRHKGWWKKLKMEIHRQAAKLKKKLIDAWHYVKDHAGTPAKAAESLKQSITGVAGLAAAPAKVIKKTISGVV